MVCRLSGFQGILQVNHELSVLIGGKAGAGINRAGITIARVLAACGYRIYMYYDYPSLIRGGHNFSIIRAAERDIGTHRRTVDFLLALDRTTLGRHTESCTGSTVTIFNADTVEADGIGVPLDTIVKEEVGTPIMANTCLIGAFCGAAGIPWEHLETVLKKEIPRGIEKNLQIARRGFDAVAPGHPIRELPQEPIPLITGNEAIGIGLLRAGLDAYVSYPMTPSSGILHFLAEHADDFGIRVIHPESEIAVMLMAQGFAYAGSRTAIGTSGGGFCLMTEGLSMAGMTEVPVAIVVSQRGGPSTGTPTYTAQSDLNFVLHAGQGEFPRFICAPGNADQAVLWSAQALEIAWKYQVPAFILVDKSVSEGLYTCNPALLPDKGPVQPEFWSGEDAYRRYADTQSGISPLACVPEPGAVIKVNSYAHDEDGLSTEDAGTVARLNEKHLRKLFALQEEVNTLAPVEVGGRPDADTALVCWGSNIGVCLEAAGELGLAVVQPLVLDPFPAEAYRRAAGGFASCLVVEDNSTGQLARLLAEHGFGVEGTVLRYDGRPFALEELVDRLKEVIS
jgi:2-oxoglutarate ferredoxin oxidoreductase subunit alpha